MTENQLVATERLTAALIAKLAWDSIASNPPAVRENLLLSKNEQTLSGLLAHSLSSLNDLHIGRGSDPTSGTVLLELKGKDYQREVNGAVQTTRNFHDLAVVNHVGRIEVIIENKYWYHFDGAKGVKSPGPEVGIREQLNGDIYKIRQSLAEGAVTGRGFVLINVVTPGEPEAIPKSYQGHHNRLWKRMNADIEQYRSEGLSGVLSVVSEFQPQALHSYCLHSSPLQSGEGFIDIICAEVKL